MKIDTLNNAEQNDHHTHFYGKKLGRPKK